MNINRIPAAVAVWFGRARVLHGEHHCDTDHGLLIEFPDTRSLQEALNTGATKFDMTDDTVAVVVAQRKSGHPDR